MDTQPTSHSLFEVYLRLRPANTVSTSGDRFLDVDVPEPSESAPKHITLNPPADRRRAIEKFAFTQVFEEDATQLDVFHCTGVAGLVEGVLAPYGDGTDALLATLGVTGSGKTHTMLGTRSQRGLTQMSLDLIYRSLGHRVLDPSTYPNLEQSISASDPSEANILPATAYLESVYSTDPTISFLRGSGNGRSTPLQNESSTPRRFRPSALPQNPDISHLTIPFDASAEYAIVISMYEVYNDRIFDLLSSPVKSAATKEYRRRPLLFKPTELSPDRKVVAGLRKVVCGSLDQALMVLEAGLQERRVAGTESNTQSSRSHGFFVVEVKKRFSLGGQHTGWYGGAGWTGNSLTIVDLAGSERARDAKTVGQTLAEAGKINESLMYLGQCLQMQVAGGKEKPNLGLIRRCKLTELLFTNSFPTGNNQQQHRNPQKGIMIVTADPHGDFNATSQILRYSALAKEVTVPRQPPSFPPPNSFSNSLPPIGSPNHQYLSFQQTLESAALEISRLQEDLTYLRHALDSERSLREQAEAHLLSMEDKMVELEQAIREDCAEEFEKRLELEVNRWKTIVDGERERGEEFWRGKWGVFERMVEADGDVDMDMDVDSPKKPENTRLVETRTAEGQEARRQLEILADENERLQRENESLKQALAACIDPAKSTSKNKSPSRRSPSRSRRKKAQLNYAEDDDGFFQELKRDQGDMAMDGFGEGNGVGGSHGTGSPTKKKRIRRLGAKKWGQGLDDDDPF
ncbi:kinesin family protein, variant [Neurospora crassa OR74A]|uniref:Kinesin family protein, variant n=1 Tax=Neurospora crassa (strain ATCC 24698 / 74-OR23-1A / CBS 708.71 / DSM 1257 / FGSC 987) TaxID=367110 RepID=V5IQS4_NEUCR|nr:kinesin family protein, variant [Neurospora crassa OR74A]ESA43106.1 kinesin family protein, variant [Neurospora crassa OR74A]|eukprot:XP_011394126.1 kinesin family protein, variant [Neurospora crassa OR74A]